MIDVKLVRENPKLVKENIRKKYQNKKVKLVDEVIELDEKWRKEKGKIDNLRANRNRISESINLLIKSGKKNDTKKLIKEAKEIPAKILRIEKKAGKLRIQIDDILKQLPNIMHESVPKGKGEEENVEIEKIGEAKVPGYEIFNHAELAERLNGLDLESSRKTSGQGFYFLRGDLARLHSAILTYARDFMIEKGFEYIIPPFMIRGDVVKGVMSFEEMDSMMYKIDSGEKKTKKKVEAGNDLYLIGTSEHSLVGMFSERVYTRKEMPRAVTAYSPCFRKEKGAHGIEERGLFRVHQFEKQEMVVVCEPKDSWKWYDVMLGLTVEFFRNLQIPVRKLECCSGDLADLKAKSCDVEAWSPRQKKYFEVGSCSNLTDAQARRLGIRISDGKQTLFAHTLNNTVVASPRALIALMENNQNEDGSINVPVVLQKYMGGKKVLEIPQKIEKIREKIIESKNESGVKMNSKKDDEIVVDMKEVVKSVAPEGSNNGSALIPEGDLKVDVEDKIVKKKEDYLEGELVPEGDLKVDAETKVVKGRKDYAKGELVPEDAK